MPKLTCSVCRCCKKEKFFPNEQPYSDKYVCDKCINKNTRSNNTMASMLSKRSGETMSDEEKKAISLSFNTVSEIKQLAKDNPSFSNTMRDLAECTNREVIYEYLNPYNLSQETKDELASHFHTVALVNDRAREKNNNANL